jgi:hypothetical protein
VHGSDALHVAGALVGDDDACLRLTEQ